MTTQQISGIQIERQPSQKRLEELGVFGWSIWTKAISEFPEYQLYFNLYRTTKSNFVKLG
jgi:hypothetical protein